MTGFLCTNILLTVLYVFCTVNGDSQPEVTIAQGTVRGKYTNTFRNRKIASFEGIPFAKPPVGELRFKEPVPAESWTGTLVATKPPPPCIQHLVIKRLIEKLPGSEDCLYINVYTPMLPSKDKPKLLDVIAFIHGGGFVAGDSLDHGPFILLDRDLVLVTFNYRLGILGFLSTEDSVVPGNNGLKDQTLALKWIQQNIAAFGGNPKSVTLGGLSAGGASCSLHLLSPLSRGLFKGALCMSGVAINPWAMAENSKEKARNLASYLGCPTDNTTNMIGCLRTKPAKDLEEQLGKFMYNNALPLAPFAPIVEPKSDNAFISDLPLNIIKQKKALDVPVVFSYAVDEGALFISISMILTALRDSSDNPFGAVLYYNHTVRSDRRKEIRKKIEDFYKMDREADIKPYIKVLGDRLFAAGISKLVKASAAQYTSPVYLYRFNYKGSISTLDYMTFMRKGKSELDNYPHATHGDDALFTIGISILNNQQVKRDSQLTKEMQDMWVSFAANGTLEGDFMPVQEKLPKIVFTDIRGPGDFELTVEDEVGEESFWDSLGLDEDFEPSTINSGNLMIAQLMVICKIFSLHLVFIKLFQ